MQRDFDAFRLYERDWLNDPYSGFTPEKNGLGAVHQDVNKFRPSPASTVYETDTSWMGQRGMALVGPGPPVDPLSYALVGLKGENRWSLLEDELQEQTEEAKTTSLADHEQKKLDILMAKEVKKTFAEKLDFPEFAGVVLVWDAFHEGLTWNEVALNGQSIKCFSMGDQKVELGVLQVVGILAKLRCIFVYC